MYVCANEDTDTVLLVNVYQLSYYKSLLQNKIISLW